MSSCWPAICASPAGKAPYSATPRSASDWSRAAKRLRLRVVGRSRALEIVLSDDFNADVAERYGWVNRTLDDNDLDSFVDTLVRRLASFDRETLAAPAPRLIGSDADSYRASIEQRHVLLDAGLAQCAGAPGQGR